MRITAGSLGLLYIPGPKALYGEQIRAFIELPNGGIECPICELEMAAAEKHDVYYCGSGRFGDGHWLSSQDRISGDN